MSLIKFLWRRLTTKRTDLVFVHYNEADKYLSKGYELAKEEDYNHVPLFVYLELRE